MSKRGTASKTQTYRIEAVANVRHHAFIEVEASSYDDAYEMAQELSEGDFDNWTMGGEYETDIEDFEVDHITLSVEG